MVIMSEATDIPAPTNNQDNLMKIPELTFTVCDEDDEHLEIDEYDEHDLRYGEESDDDVDDDVDDDGDLEARREKLNNYYNSIDDYSNDGSNPGSPGQSPPDNYSHNGDFSPSFKITLPRLLNFRKMSDHGLNKLRHHLHRMRITGRVSNLSTSCASNDSQEDNAAHLPNSRSVQDNLRKMSVDSNGILKHHHLHQEDNKRHLLAGFRLSRKSVSFCQRNNVRVYDNWSDEDENGNDEIDDIQNQKPVPPPELIGKSLVPTFVFPGKKPDYGKTFEESVLKLESLNITEDFCLMGNIRVNMTRIRNINKEQEKLSKSVTVKQRASVFAVFTFDQWKTWKETKAMVVKAQQHPALKNIETHAMRFYIDCDDMEVGDAVEFAILCSDKRHTVKQGTRITKKLRTGIGHNKELTTVIRKYHDDNDGKFYQAKCTKKLNPWAEKAARELKNFTPIVKYNKSYVK